MVYNKQKYKSIIEFELFVDGEFLVSITDDYTISNGVDFIFTKEEFKTLKEFFKEFDNDKGEI